MKKCALWVAIIKTNKMKFSTTYCTLANNKSYYYSQLGEDSAMPTCQMAVKAGTSCLCLHVWFFMELRLQTDNIFVAGIFDILLRCIRIVTFTP